MTTKNKTTNTVRIPYEASPTEMATVAEIKNHLYAAFGRTLNISTQML